MRRQARHGARPTQRRGPAAGAAAGDGRAAPRAEGGGRSRWFQKAPKNSPPKTLNLNKITKKRQQIQKESKQKKTNKNQTPAKTTSSSSVARSPTARSCWAVARASPPRNDNAWPRPWWRRHKRRRSGETQRCGAVVGSFGLVWLVGFGFFLFLFLFF